MIEVLTKVKGSVASISSGCELFLRFITLASLDNPVCVVCLLIRMFQSKSSQEHCVVPENIDTFTTEGHWKFQGGGGSSS